jgi:hypothetical protein
MSMARWMDKPHRPGLAALPELRYVRPGFLLTFSVAGLLAHELDIRVIAEGVEDLDTLATWRRSSATKLRTSATCSRCSTCAIFASHTIGRVDDALPKAKKSLDELLPARNTATIRLRVAGLLPPTGSK